MKVIRITEFSEFPGPRYISLGPYSGEAFRKQVLIPNIQAHAGKLIVDLDGALGYGSSFLDEAFGGLIREGVDSKVVLEICENLKSQDDPSLKIQITQWVKEAIDIKNQDNSK
jgi:hypothetical protein